MFFVAIANQKQMMCDYNPLNPSAQAHVKCLGLDVICDGVANCLDNSDEGLAACLRKRQYTCEEGQFACPTERRCINETSICDGKVDCQIETDYTTIDMVLGVEEYHTDEDRGFCMTRHDCPSGTTSCDNDWQCVLSEDQCYQGEASNETSGELSLLIIS